MKKIFIYIIIFLVIFILGIFAYAIRTKAPVITDSGNFPILPKQEGLPLAVEAKRQAIYKAAKEKNYEKLANEAELDLKYSFGGDVEGGFIAYLKAKPNNDSGEIFNILSKLLELPYGQQGKYYAWPSVFTKESKDWTEEDTTQMKTLLTDQEIESYRKFGGYAYYRIGITDEGKWVYFIAGD